MTDTITLSARTEPEVAANTIAQLLDADWSPLTWRHHALRACDEVGITPADLKAAKERLDAGRVRKPVPTLAPRPELVVNGNGTQARPGWSPAQPDPEVDEARKYEASHRAHKNNPTTNPLPGLRRCALCKVEQGISSFGWHNRPAGQMDTYCVTCRETVNQAQKARKNEAKCAKCGAGIPGICSSCNGGKDV
ncbi:MAG: hypothetical protein M3404_01880 [Actinomycetota bacterium]|nr:hypothetical protein [Actinomycetota bacterium]